MGDVIILADYSRHSGSFRQVAQTCMARLDPSSFDVTTSTVDGLKLSCCCRAGLLYGTISGKEANLSLNREFLRQLAELLVNSGHKSQELLKMNANELQGALSSNIGNLLEHANQHPEEYSKPPGREDPDSCGAFSDQNTSRFYIGAQTETNAVMARADDQIALIIGNNPAFEEVGGASSDARSRVFSGRNITCGIVCVVVVVLAGSTFLLLQSSL